MTQILLITLPMISGVVRVIAALVLITTLDSSFEQVINLYNPAVYATGDIVDTYVYRTGLVQGRLGPAAAAGLAKALMNTVLLGAFLAVFRPRREHRYA